MKNLVLKVPTAIFVVLVFLPILIWAMQLVAEKELIEPKYYPVLSIIGSVVSSIWLVSIIDYFQSKAPNFKYTKLIYVLIALDLIVSLLEFFALIDFGPSTPTIFTAVQFAFFIPTVVFITLLIRKVFYERSVWFIVVEILTVVVGIFTLTPEIKRHEKEVLAQEIE